MVITFNSIVILQMEGQVETVECIALWYPTRCALLMCTGHCSIVGVLCILQNSNMLFSTFPQSRTVFSELD